MAFRYLDDQTLATVRQTAIDLNYATDANLATLTSGMSPAFVGQVMAGGTALAKLMTLLNEMNRTKVLVSGEVPLERFLTAAIVLAAGREPEIVFRSAMRFVVPEGATDTAVDTAVGDANEDHGGVTAGEVAPDVEAVPSNLAGLEIEIDEDDTLEVGFLHDGSTASRSVAKLLVHRHFDGAPSFIAGNHADYGKGTGWLIAPRLLITNHHVINARIPLEPPASDADFALQGAATEIQFDFHKLTSTTLMVRSVACLATDRALDFALLRLPDDVADRRPLRLRANPITKPKDRALKERVNVLQHPNGDAMRLGFRNNFVVTGSEMRLSYLTDTAGGSSGSPICDDAWLVAGLHRGFDTIPGGVTVWGKSIFQENYGTPIGQILKFLENHHPDLHGEIVVGQAALPVVT